MPKEGAGFFDKYAPTNSMAPVQVTDFHTVYPYSGVSGPGVPVVGEGMGGWRSGSTGVLYQGLHPKPYFTVLPSDSTTLTTRSAVTSGILPPIKPLIEAQVRDTVITLGGDGNYYMTGSTGENIWAFNDGVELWKSRDLKHWSYIGLVWSLDKDAGWEKQTRMMHEKPVRAIWAPEIHYIHHNYFICLSMAPGGIGLLKSSTGKAEGPYINALSSDAPLTTGIDATLFEDDDGTVYFTSTGGNRIARMKDDMSGFAEPFHDIKLEDPDHDPAHHAAKCVDRGTNDIGHEGAVLFKANGIYYLGAADSYEGRYSTMVTMSKTIYGPYHGRHESVPTAGGTGFFKDKKGRWWTTYFGNDEQAAWREKPGIVRIEFAPDGHIVVSHHQPFVDDPKWK
jgi:beta-xylosidase